MLNKVLNEGMKIEDAQEWAQKDMMDSYNQAGEASLAAPVSATSALLNDACLTAMSAARAPMRAAWLAT